MVGIFDCGGVLGKYEIRLKERKVVNMEALNTYKTEKTLAEQMNERLAEMKMTKAEAALKMNYSRAALSQYLNGKYASDPTELEKKVREFLAATGGVAEGQEPENSVPTGAGTLKKKVEFFESRDFVQTIGVCQACQEYMGLGIIVGKSGQGKTHALKKYAELPRVAYIECDDTMACRDLVEAIENGIGLPKGYGGTIWSRVNRIREFFNTNEGFLTRALIEETTLEDISESYRPVVDIIGIEKFIELSEYAKGDEIYFPKTENIIAPARNRRIKKEWNGYNSKELAEKYNLTTKQIGNILKDEPMIGQMSIFDMNNDD